MSKQMTQCEKLGYKVGDKFKVVDGTGAHYAVGSFITLIRDDGTSCPKFNGVHAIYESGDSFFPIDFVEKVAKLKPAKQALADAIHQNGGWRSGANWACQHGLNRMVVFSASGLAPTRNAARGMACWNSGAIFFGGFQFDRKLPNWHQCVLNREEYYQAYPMTDDDGWVEWKGGECPVYGDDDVDVVLVDDSTGHGIADEFDWHRDSGPLSVASYRPHKPEVKPEFCESVTRSIPEPEAKPTIEQLVQDYRNKLDFANRKQQDADDAKAAADAALGELEHAGEALGLLIVIAKPATELELVITDWRDLMVGDVVEITGSSNNCWKDHSWQEMTVKDVYPEHGDNDDQVYLIGESGDWCLGGNTTWRFIRRP